MRRVGLMGSHREKAAHGAKSSTDPNSCHAAELGQTGRQQNIDLKVIASGGGALLAASAFGNGLNYAFGIFLARTLGAEDFGLYALALTIFNMVGLTVVFGMDVGATRFVSHHLSGAEYGKARRTIAAAASIAFVSGLVSAVGLSLLAQPIATNVYGKPELVSSLLLFSIAIPFSALTAVLLSTLQAHQTVWYTISIKYLWEPIGKFLLAGVALWMGFQLVGVLCSFVVAIAISALFAIYAVYERAFGEGVPVHLWSRQEASALLAYSFPLVLSNLFGVVAPRSDILILGYWTNAQEVGIYLATFQTAAIMALVLSAFDTSLGPIISRAWSRQDKERMKEGLQAVSRLSMTAALPIFSCLLVFSKDILGIFGSEFAKGSAALMILAFGQVFNTGTGSANTILLMSGHSRLVMTNTVVMGITLLLATATIIPFWGITGAAVAATTIFILTNIVRVSQVWRLHGVQPYTWLLIKPIVAATIATIFTGVLHQWTQLIPVPVLVCILFALYLGLLWRMGIGDQDRVMLSGLVSQGRNLFARG